MSEIIQEYLDSAQLIIKSSPNNTDFLELQMAYHAARLKIEAITNNRPLQTCTTQQNGNNLWFLWIILIIILIVVLVYLFSKIKIPKVRWE